ncbi:leukocyte cell-derived chemotaxin-2 [Ornithorhynchus anatinus]|uniref:Transforming growth factor beta induced n=1 Tax=Ornithorhynchus anatinus TaxID=9258 RepID=A0A6I8PS17_ORNAN|nr:leukocyte cell-derived chemotaxin-2 [Ornithorhynchus anatinus]
MFWGKLFLLAALISTVWAAKWNHLCAGRPQNKIRGNDKYGSGSYGAPRGKRVHKGVDVLCSDGSTVLAPFSGVIQSQAKPYGNGNAIDDGIRMTGGGNCVLMFYIKPKKYKGNIKKGEILGQLLPMQRVYPKILSHVHIQNCDLSDPTPNL